MTDQTKPAGSAAAADAGDGAPVRYETGKGCLTLSLALLGLIGITVLAIWLFGTPPGG